jgi:predicted aminopeptidase
MNDFRLRYEELKEGWGGYKGYDAWVARSNNAALAGLSDQNRDRILEAFLETANPDIGILSDLVTP